MVVDLETGKEIYLDPDAARQSYQERFAQHQRELQSICDSLGVDLHEVRTDQPLERALSQLISTQRQKSQSTRLEPE